MCEDCVKHIWPATTQSNGDIGVEVQLNLLNNWARTHAVHSVQNARGEIPECAAVRKHLQDFCNLQEPSASWQDIHVQQASTR